MQRANDPTVQREILTRHTLHNAVARAGDPAGVVVGGWWDDFREGGILRGRGGEWGVSGCDDLILPEGGHTLLPVKYDNSPALRSLFCSDNR